MPWECPACQNVNQDDQKNCTLCGKPRDTGSETQILENPPPPPSSEQPTRLMRVTCPNCHAPVLPGLETCPECNTPVLSTDHAIAIPSMTVETGADEGHVKIKIKTGADASKESHPASEIDDDITPTRIDERLLTYETMDLEDTRLLRPPKKPEPVSRAEPESNIRVSPESSPPVSTPETGPPPPSPESSAQATRPSSYLPRWAIPLWGLAFAIGIIGGIFFLRPFVKPDYWILDHPAAFPQPQIPQNSSASPTSLPPSDSPMTNETANRMKYSKLTVSFPLYASVYLDRTFIGTTPLIDHPIPPGKHRVTIELPPTSTAPPSLRRQAFTITAQPDQSVVLEPPINIYGRLYINSYPWSKVTIDGKLIGPTPLILTHIVIGTHTVRLQTPDGRTYEATIDIDENSITRFSHRFQSP